MCWFIPSWFQQAGRGPYGAIHHVASLPSKSTLGVSRTYISVCIHYRIFWVHFKIMEWKRKRHQWESCSVLVSSFAWSSPVLLLSWIQETPCNHVMLLRRHQKLHNLLGTQWGTIIQHFKTTYASIFSPSVSTSLKVRPLTALSY